VPPTASTCRRDPKKRQKESGRCVCDQEREEAATKHFVVEDPVQSPLHRPREARGGRSRCGKRGLYSGHRTLNRVQDIKSLVTLIGSLLHYFERRRRGQKITESRARRQKNGKNHPPGLRKVGNIPMRVISEAFRSRPNEDGLRYPDGDRHEGLSRS